MRHNLYHIIENVIGRYGMLGRDLFSVDDKKSKSLNMHCVRHCSYQSEADDIRVIWHYKNLERHFAMFNSLFRFYIWSDVIKLQDIVDGKKQYF